MRVLLVAGAALVTLAGCARLATPHAPLVTTAEGRRCVRQCQALHARCLARVSPEIRESRVLSAASPHLGSCHASLSDCYATCPA